MASPQILRSAPVLLVRDIQAAAACWRDLFGFEVTLYHEPPNFAVATRGNGAAMLALAPPFAPITPNWRLANACNQAYFWVDDAKALYEELIGRGAKIDFTLYDTPWGTREFGVQDADEYDIAFGQLLR